MKLKIPNLPKMDRVLNDKNVLYIVFVIAILNLLGYLLVRNIESVVFFLMVGFLTTHFSKNMIVVLMTAVISTSIFTSSRSSVYKMFKEGMTSKKNTSKDNEKEVKAKKLSVDNPLTNDKTDEIEDEPEDGKEVKEPMSTSTKSHKKNRLDYASTMEKAFTNLKHTIGEGGVEGLTNQTQKLIQQQEVLMNNIKGLEPILKSAESFMNNLNIGGLDGLSGMLSKLGGGNKKE